MSITASGLGEFAYCEKKWALARKYGRLSRVELEKRLKELAADGKTRTAEYALFQRMASSQVRMDAGTAAHTDHAKQATTGRQADTMSWVVGAAALILIAIAAALFLR